jgi:hypothetical protein
MSDSTSGTGAADRTSAGDESTCGVMRSAVLPPAGIRAVQRGPVQLRLVPPRGPVDAQALLDEIRDFGLGTEDLSVEVLESLVEVLPRLLALLMEDNSVARDFDRDPGAFRELLGGELAGLATRVRADSGRMRSVLRPPWTGESIRRAPRRRADRQLTATDPAVEERTLVLRRRIMEWSAAEEANMAQLGRDPETVIRRLGTGEPEAVQRLLMAVFTENDGD